MPVAEFDRADTAAEAAPFDVVKESGNAAAAAGAAFGAVAGSLALVPIVGPVVGTAVGFGVGQLIGRWFAKREIKAKDSMAGQDVNVKIGSPHSDDLNLLL